MKRGQVIYAGPLGHHSRLLIEYFQVSIIISGYPKNQSTFARISGYCEQNDIHSPHVTVYESLIYSAWLRLSPDVKKETRKVFTPIISSLGPQKPHLLFLHMFLNLARVLVPSPDKKGELR